MGYRGKGRQILLFRIMLDADGGYESAVRARVRSDWKKFCE